MRQGMFALTVIGFTVALSALATTVSAGQPEAAQSFDKGQGHSVQLGPRPFFLVEDMDEGELKAALQQCAKGPFRKSDFSIGHRGAAMQFPEHTKESYVAAARMGAGIVECDVTFTSDKELVCRHSQADLATTTNILVTPLAATCVEPFSPAEFDADGNRTKAASATCRTSEITLEEFKSLKGKMDAADRDATTPEQFLGGTADFRTDLYAADGTLMSHAESIELFRELGVKFTPELKSPSVTMPFFGFTQEDYAQKMIDEYTDAGIPPEDVWAQSFSLADVEYWIANTPKFGNQAVWLDGRYGNTPPIDPDDPATFDPTMDELAAVGVNIIAPPMWMLVTLDGDQIVPSAYTNAAKAAGLDIITWTLERSGVLTGGTGGGFYYQSTASITDNDGDAMTMLDVLAQDVGVLGVFSDWPATVTYYANCMNLK
ncbi:MAG: glycerophosphodiester phosphodiesterase [Proteobacteria bacterium]|nr:glycerophosphodiester phosphodiesterase [Pseudomonadota bacterium]